MSYIEFKNVSKIYQMGEVEIKALDDVSFEIDKGEFVCVLGASGAGKTTILNILGGMDSASKGSIFVDGQDISLYDEKQLCDYRRYDIGFVFQFYNLVGNLTAKENVELVTQIAKQPLDARFALQLVGLQDRVNNFPSQLSGGEQQRVAIARALINNPAVLFADEPSGNLDSRTKEELHKLFFTLRDRFGQTIVIVTHDPSLAAMSDRTLFMRDGIFTDPE